MNQNQKPRSVNPRQPSHDLDPVLLMVVKLRCHIKSRRTSQRTCLGRKGAPRITIHHAEIYPRQNNLPQHRQKAQAAE